MSLCQAHLVSLPCPLCDQHNRGPITFVQSGEVTQAGNARYIIRRQAFAEAIAACEQLIRDYEAHRDPGGIVTGPDFNAEEIEAVKAAILRIECAESASNATVEGDK